MKKITEVLKFIKSVMDRTEESKLIWQPTETRNTYQAAITAENVIRINHLTCSFIFNIYDSEGESVHSFCIPKKINKVKMVPYSYLLLYAHIEILYETIKNRVKETIQYNKFE